MTDYKHHIQPDDPNFVQRPNKKNYKIKSCAGIRIN